MRRGQRTYFGPTIRRTDILVSTLWIIIESDLHPLSRVNIMFKHADDTNLLVPENTDIPVSDQSFHIRLWAESNGLIINLDKTKELVLHRPHPSKHSLPSHLRILNVCTLLNFLE